MLEIFVVKALSRKNTHNLPSPFPINLNYKRVDIVSIPMNWPVIKFYFVGKFPLNGQKGRSFLTHYYKCVTSLPNFMLGSGSVFGFSDPKSGFGSRLQKVWIQIRIRFQGSKKGGSNGFRIRFRIRIQSPVIYNVIQYCMCIKP